MEEDVTVTARALTLMFFCVIGLMHRLSDFSQGSAKFVSQDG